MQEKLNEVKSLLLGAMYLLKEGYEKSEAFDETILDGLQYDIYYHYDSVKELLNQLDSVKFI
mgnify:FL=1